jgi:hypothetical protein
MTQQFLPVLPGGSPQGAQSASALHVLGHTPLADSVAPDEAAPVEACPPEPAGPAAPSAGELPEADTFWAGGFPASLGRVLQAISTTSGSHQDAWYRKGGEVFMGRPPRVVDLRILSYILPNTS